MPPHSASRSLSSTAATRGDDLATVKVDGGCSEILVLLACELTFPGIAAQTPLS